MIPKSLKQWFVAPIFAGDDDKTRLAKILHVILWSLWFFTLFISPLYLNKLWRPLLLFMGITGCLYLLHRGYVHAARDVLFILMVAILNIFASSSKISFGYRVKRALSACNARALVIV